MNKIKCLLLLFQVIAISVCAQTFYITKSGSKYHTASCTYLRKSSIAKDLLEVKNIYSPCSRCTPPSEITSPRKEGKEDLQPAKLESPSTISSEKTIHTGPRGGQFHYSKSGKKVYEKKK